MQIEDADRAKRKLEQVGYYRLSDFWYPCRKFVEKSISQKKERSDRFLPKTSFNDIFNLYLFDKKLRLLMLDALERIEIYVRAVIAYEINKEEPHRLLLRRAKGGVNRFRVVG